MLGNYHSMLKESVMPKPISKSVRQRIIDITSQQGFAVQLKGNGEDRCMKNLIFYSKPLNPAVYVRKHRPVGTGSIRGYFQVVVHPDVCNKNGGSATDGIQEHVNCRKKKNLRFSINYKNFPAFSGNDEPYLCFKAADYDALAKLFQRMAAFGTVCASESCLESIN
jgi:hypothetical protein